MNVGPLATALPAADKISRQVNLALVLQRSAKVVISTEDARTFRDQQYGIAMRRGTGQPSDLLQALLARRRRLCDALVARGQAVAIVTMTVLDRLLVGAGADASPHEASIRLAAPYGLPCIPGSALKGVTRRVALAEDPARAVELLGSEPAVTEQPVPARMAFHDALPAGPASFEMDLLNPHERAYYEDPAANQPDGLNQPMPFSYPVIGAGSQFHGLVRGGSRDDVELVVAWMSRALRDEGVGSKTAVGYGYMEVDVEQIHA